MIVRDISTGAIEPVTLKEVKDQIGYAEGNTLNDDYLTRNITAMRQMLEGAIGRIIVPREFEIIPDPAVINPPTPLLEVLSFTAEDEDGNIEEVEYEVSGSPQAPLIHWCSSHKHNVRLVVRCGMDPVPEAIATCITELVKARYDRVPLDPVLDDCVKACQPYRRMRL